MRTDRAEMQAVTDVVKRLAIASPHVGFTLRDVSSGKQRVVFEALAEHGDFLMPAIVVCARSWDMTSRKMPF